MENLRFFVPDRLFVLHHTLLYFFYNLLLFLSSSPMVINSLAFGSPCGSCNFASSVEHRGLLPHISRHAGMEVVEPEESSIVFLHDIVCSVFWLDHGASTPIYCSSSHE
jgi:hypothetical protein